MSEKKNPADTGDEEDESEDEGERIVISKYAGSTYKQQKHKPLFNAVYSRTVIFLTILLICLVCICGCGYMVYHHLQPEFEFMEYTHCTNNQSVKCSGIINKNKYYFKNGDLQPECSCRIHFKIHEDFPAPVGLYIKLTNFFQNARFYAKSRDKKQFKGYIYNEKEKKPAQPANKSCADFDSEHELENDLRYVYPCGARAYSWFSDRLNLFLKNGDKEEEMPLQNKDLALHSDVEYVFKNPSGFTKDYSILPSWFNKHFKKPASWRQKTYELWWKEGAYENEAFINWMRISAHNDPKKLFRKVSERKCGNGIRGWRKGSYTMEIDYNFEVESFKGSKSIGFKTITQIGLENTFLMLTLRIRVVITLCLLPFVCCLFSPESEILQLSDDYISDKSGKGDKQKLLAKREFDGKVPHSPNGDVRFIGHDNPCTCNICATSFIPYFCMSCQFMKKKITGSRKKATENLKRELEELIKENKSEDVLNFKNFYGAVGLSYENKDGSSNEFGWTVFERALIDLGIDIDMDIVHLTHAASLALSIKSYLENKRGFGTPEVIFCNFEDVKQKFIKIERQITINNEVYCPVLLTHYRKGSSYGHNSTSVIEEHAVTTISDKWSETKLLSSVEELDGKAVESVILIREDLI